MGTVHFDSLKWWTIYCFSPLTYGHLRFTCSAQQCSEGWSQVGEACLRINSSRESYDNAQHYCKNLNGNIASLTTPKQVDFVLEELKKLQQQDKVNQIKAAGTM